MSMMQNSSMRSKRPPELYQPTGRVRLQAALARQAELARLNAQAEAGWLEASSALEDRSRSG